MNFVFKTRSCVSKTRNFVFKMMNFAEVVQKLEGEPTDQDDEMRALEAKLKEVEQERDKLKVRAARYKSERKKAQVKGSSDRKMLQEELDDAQRLIAAAMSGDTDGVVEEMKHQRDEAVSELHTVREERDAAAQQLLAQARGQEVPALVVEAANDEADPHARILETVVKLQSDLATGMPSPELPARSVPASAGAGPCQLCPGKERELERLHAQMEEAKHLQQRANELQQQLDESKAAAEAETEAKVAVLAAVSDSQAETQRLQQALTDAQALNEAAMGGDTGAIVAEIQQQLADANAAKDAAVAKAAAAGSALTELQKANDDASAEVSELNGKLEAATQEVTSYREAAEELRAIASRKPEMSPRDTQTSPEPVSTSPERTEEHPIMSPRETQTSPEQLPAVIMSPRRTQTSPEKPATVTKTVSLKDPEQVAIDTPAAQAKETFEKFDTDGDGLIDGDELKEAMEQLGIDLTDAKVAPLVERTVAEDDGGKVSMEEFIQMALPEADPERVVTEEQKEQGLAVAEGDRVQVFSPAVNAWVPGIVESIDTETHEAEVRFEAPPPPPLSADDKLRAKLAAAQKEIDEYRAAAEKLTAMPATVAPTPVVPRLENLPPPVVAEAPVQQEVQAAPTPMPPLPTPRSTGEESAALQAMQDHMSSHFEELKNQVEKLLVTAPDTSTSETNATTPRDTQTSPEPIAATTPRETQTSPEKAAHERAKEIFEHIDTNGDGLIDGDELKVAVEQLGMDETHAKVAPLVERLVAAAAEEAPATEATEAAATAAKKVFEKFDADGDGRIDGNELKEAAEELGVDPTDAKVATLMERTSTAAEATEPAKVTLAEFIEMAAPPAPPAPPAARVSLEEFVEMAKPDSMPEPPVMSPRETQTTPEATPEATPKKPVMSPRDTQTSPLLEPEPEPEVSPTQQAREIFEQIDTDGDGLIDGDELKVAVEQLGMDETHAKVAPLVERVAAAAAAAAELGDMAGEPTKVSLEEFIELAQPESKPVAAETSFDRAQMQELQEAMEMVGIEMDEMRIASTEQADKLALATESLAKMKSALDEASEAKQQAELRADGLGKYNTQFPPQLERGS